MASVREWVEKIAGKLGVAYEPAAAEQRKGPTYAETAAKQGRGFGFADIGMEEEPKAEGKSTGENRDVQRQKTYR